MEPLEKCRAFLDLWTEISFHDPKAGRIHAEEGLRRVKALGNPPILLARALAFSGSSLRTVDLATADDSLEKSLRLYRDEVHAPLDEADAYRRRAIVQADFPNLETAKDYANIARKIAEPRDTEQAARALNALGRICSLERDYVTAFRHIATAAPDLNGIHLEAALQNLPVLLIYTARENQKVPAPLLEEGLSLVRLARMTPTSQERWRDRPLKSGRYARNPKCTPADTSARWAAGLLLDYKRHWNDAASVLERVVRDFLELADPQQAASAALDLGMVYAKLGRWRKLARHARFTLAIVRKDTPEAVAAFQQWQHAAIKLQDIDCLRGLSDLCRDAVCSSKMSSLSKK